MTAPRSRRRSLARSDSPPASRPERAKRNAPWHDCVEIEGPNGIRATLYLGDCREVMRALEAESLHAVVTDPPYELGFMGKAWDKAGGVASDPETWGLAKALLKPGGHLVAFAGSRTYHRIATAIERSGFEIRDQLMWLYGSGFPKSHDIAKCIDKAGGVWRGKAGAPLPGDPKEVMLRGYQRAPKGAAVFDDAKRWEGWGTALKPAHEPIALARKPFRGTVTGNVQTHGTGAINVDAARVGEEVRINQPGSHVRLGNVTGIGIGFRSDAEPRDAIGRWPANVLTDGSLEVLEAFPSSAREAIRFFYAAKADRSEREYGLRDGKRATQRVANHHPTVKPIDLMRWLCRLITPPAGRVLEPFMGSGSTGIAALREGFHFVGIEQSAEYFDIARRRIAQAADDLKREPDLVREVDRAVHALRAEQMKLEV